MPRPRNTPKATASASAWDRSEPDVLYGIIRATDDEEDQGLTNRVVVFDSNVGGPDRKDKDKSYGADRRHER